MSENVLVISSSPNYQGNSNLAATWLVSGINQEKYNVDWIHLYNLHIQSYTNKNRNADIKQIDDQDTRKIITRIEKSDKIIITTPIWNFSLPSVLKNLLDRALYSGRVSLKNKQTKVPGWPGKRFYLLFTMGAPWYKSWFNYLGVIQIYLTLKYYGARPKIIKVICNAGSGEYLIIKQRINLQRKLVSKGQKYFG